MTKSIDKNMIGKTLYWLLLVVMLLPLKNIFGLDSEPISAPIALMVGLVFALTTNVCG